jgi:hypothetical protein
MKKVINRGVTDTASFVIMPFIILPTTIAKYLVSGLTVGSMK